jgi:hypothetical protein
MSGHTLKYFMWSWQHQFQWLAADNAKRLLKPLDAQLESDAFLVGFLLGEINGCHPICVSPDDCRYQPEIFTGVCELAERLAKEDPGSQIRYSAPTLPDLGERLANQRGLQRAVELILAEFDEKSVFFASHPTPVEAYAVLVVVRVDRERLTHTTD